MAGSGEYLLSYPFHLIFFDLTTDIVIQNEYYLPANGFPKLSPIGDKFVYVSFRKKQSTDLVGEADLWIVDISELIKKFKTREWTTKWLSKSENQFLWEGMDKTVVSVEELHPKKKDWVLSYFDFKLKDGTVINGRLYSKKDNELYIKDKKLIYILNRENLLAIYDDEEEVTEEVLKHAKEQEIKRYKYIIKRIE